MPLESSKEREEHRGETSSLPYERSESIDAKPKSNASTEGKTVAEPEVDEPKPDHHKRKDDAVAAAKERFLARKKAKEQ